MAASCITTNDVRIFMQDRTENNTLVSGVRFSDKDIEHAMVMAVDYFNSIPPPTGYNYTIEKFPFRVCLLLGTCGWLLKGAAVNQASNELAYSADGVTVDDKNKAQLFTSLGTQFWQEFREMANNIKITQNVNEAYGRVSSEYIQTARTY